jgi:hypothetical protein
MFHLNKKNMKTLSLDKMESIQGGLYNYIGCAGDFYGFIGADDILGTIIFGAAALYDGCF